MVSLRVISVGAGFCAVTNTSGEFSGLQSHSPDFREALATIVTNYLT
jgi:hypothetical protein